MNLKAQLKAALDRVKELQKAAATDDGLTEEQITETTTLAKTVEDLRAKIAAADDAAAKIKAMSTDDGDAPEDDDPDGDPGPGVKGGGGGGGRVLKAKSFGEAFTKSAPYQEFRKAHPTGVGEGTPVSIGRIKVGDMAGFFSGRKATLTTPLAHIQPTRMPMVDMVDRDNLTILDLISRGESDGPFEYVQVTGVTRNAAIVPESTSPSDAAGLKPTSDMTTQLAEAKPHTYADGYDVTTQLLSNAPAFASYMDMELSYSLDSVIEDKLLNGAGTAAEPAGLLNTTGVQAQTYSTVDVGGNYDPTNQTDVMTLVKAIRRAMTKVNRLAGGTVTAVLMSPEDDEAWDLLQDTTDRFMGQGPFGMGPSTSWGRTRALSERLAPGTVILGDWKQMQLLDVEGLSIQAFNQHADFAKRNLVYVRAELRAMQVIWKPNRLVVVSPVAP